MKVTVRFFARFRELLGSEIQVMPAEGTSIGTIIKKIASKNPKGYDALFDAGGSFHEFVILMKNGTRVESADAEKTLAADGDEIAIFPPVAGG